MRSRKLLVGYAVVALGVVAFILASVKGSSVSPEELAARIAASHPSWQSYEEDIKGQIGAGPVAEWEGTLVAVQAEPGALCATFRVTGPWADRDAGIPILLRSASGKTFQSVSTRREDGRVQYRFDLGSDTDPMPPWVELKYPFYGNRRVPLSEQGSWEEASS